MELKQRSHLLEVTEDEFKNIRKIYDFDKPLHLNQAVNILKSWLEKQNHILRKDFSPEYLEKTLLSCKGSIEKAKKQIDRLATMKTLLPKFFIKTDIKNDMKEVLGMAFIVPLPKQTEDFHRLVVIKFKFEHLQSHRFIILLYYRLLIILVEYMKAHDYTNGFTIIEDFRDINLMNVISNINAVELQQLMTILIEGYGARMKNIYLLTQSKTIELLLKMIRPFFTKKINERLHVVPTLEQLHDRVPKELLPLEYGGKEKSIYKFWDEWIEALSSPEHQEYLEMMNKACTDENLRSSSKYNEEIMGMPGSFRHLSVD